MEREGETEGRTEDQAGRLEAASADDGKVERSTPARSQTVVWTSDTPQRPGDFPTNLSSSESSVWLGSRTYEKRSERIGRSLDGHHREFCQS